MSKKQTSIAFNVDLNVDLPKILDGLENTIRIKANIGETMFIWDEDHARYIGKDIALGNLVYAHSKDNEYSTYTDYKDMGKPTGRQVQALKLIKDLRKYFNA